MTKLAVALAVAAAAAAVGAARAPSQASATIGCKEIATHPPATAGNTGGVNLTIGTLTFWHMGRLSDPVAFRSFRRGGVYRVPTYASVNDTAVVAVAARGGGGSARFAFGPRPVAATVLTILPCPAPLASIFKGVVVV